MTKDTIKIGQWSPQTGPASLVGFGVSWYGPVFQMVNEAGGINGRKIEYFNRDDGYQPNKTKAIVKELVEGKASGALSAAWAPARAWP